jgi:phospholipid/cholesterol/gamma-HCH transport system substrate-binding protein
VSIAPPAADEPDGLVHLRLRIKGEYRHLVRADSTVKIVSEGMLGGKVLEIHRARPLPGRPSPPQGPAQEDALLTSEPSTELTDVLGEVGQTLKGIQGGQGTLGKLARDEQAYDALVGLLRQSSVTMQSIQQDAEVLKRLPLVGSYVEDPVALLLRPGCERNRQWFAEEDLFEPGRAVLTAQGRQRLDDLAPWLEGLKHKGSDVVVVSYANPNKANARTARELTLQQSEAVCAYLKQHHSIQKMGWFTSRKMTALGQGVQPPPAPERDSLPPARVEVLVFVPQG